MKKIFLLIGFGFLLFSRKKEKLEGDKSIFIGKWSWVYSRHKFDYCDGDPNTTEIIIPDTDGNNYSIEFLEKGIVKYYANGNYLEKDRIVLSQFELDGDFYEFAINLNNDAEITGTFNGYVSADSLILRPGFPYDNYEVGCETYVSYFAKE